MNQSNGATRANLDVRQRRGTHIEVATLIKVALGLIGFEVMTLLFQYRYPWSATDHSSSSSSFGSILYIYYFEILIAYPD